MAKKKKLHWTQTPEGKKKLKEVSAKAAAKKAVNMAGPVSPEQSRTSSQVLRVEGEQAQEIREARQERFRRKPYRMEFNINTLQIVIYLE